MTDMKKQTTDSSEFWQLLKEDRLTISGLLVFVLFFGIALTGLLLTTGQDPVLDPSLVRLQEKLLPPFTAPDSESVRPEQRPLLGVYLFGTDDLGRDVFARMMQGAWVSLTVGFVAVGIAVCIGIVVGGLAGYYGHHRFTLGRVLLFLLVTGAITTASLQHHLAAALFLLPSVIIFMAERQVENGSSGKSTTLFRFRTLSVDTIIMRFVDIMLCFPSFFLILTVVAILPASIYNIMIVIGLTSWMGTARFVRAEFLSLREQDFVTAARALGIGDLRIIFRHMIPNAVAPVLVSATIGIATAILTEAGLSFLGFGVPPPHATWGNILADGKRFLFDAPWLTFIPGIAILVVVLSFNLFGEGLRDIMNPRLRSR
jgi:peptide/nickel transport system permease protein